MPEEQHDPSDTAVGEEWDTDFCAGVTSDRDPPTLNPLKSPEEYIRQFWLGGITEQERRLDIFRHSPGRSTVNLNSRLATQDKIKVTGELCDRLEVTEGQTKRSQAVMIALNLDAFGSQKRIENVALAVIRHVHLWEHHQRDAIPEPRLSSTPTYKALLEEFDLDHGDIMRISTVLKEQLRDLD